MKKETACNPNLNTLPHPSVEDDNIMAYHYWGLYQTEDTIARSHLSKSRIAFAVMVGAGIINPLVGIIMATEFVRQAKLYNKHSTFSEEASVEYHAHKIRAKNPETSELVT